MVAKETAVLLDGNAVVLLRYDQDVSVAVASYNSPAPLGMRVPSPLGTPTGEVLRTGRSVRVDAFDETELALVARDLGVRSGVAVPITVEGRILAMLTTSSSEGPLPLDTERQLSEFAELAAVALANAEANDRLFASRARIVVSADDTRRQLQREVHDGAQQRLVHATIALKMAQASGDAGPALAALIDEALLNVERASGELREMVRGILPRALTFSGLTASLESLVADFVLPVDLRVDTPRLTDSAETTAYLVVAEALSNAAKHAQATHAVVNVKFAEGVLTIEVRDDGIGGADPDRGRGLTGLSDRIAAVNGSMTITSPTHAGTALRVTLPSRLADEPPSRSGSNT